MLSDNVFGYLWGKAGYGAILKASALDNLSIADCIANPARREALVALVREVLAVAEAENVAVLGFNGFDPEGFRQGDEAAIAASMDRMEAFNRASAKSHSGIWRDLAVRRRQSDVAAQLAPVRAAARRHGLPSVLMDRLVALITEIEAGRREIGPATADALGESLS